MAELGFVPVVASPFEFVELRDFFFCQGPTPSVPRRALTGPLEHGRAA